MDVVSSAEDAEVSLVQLPDPCLLAVLRCCDTLSMCSAARAHSRLHQKAVEALTSITLDTSRNISVSRRQPRLDSLVEVYLPRHGHRVDSISLGAGCLQQLPTALTKLTSLTARHMQLQLHPGCGFQGVLGAAVTPPLKRLRLHECIIMMDFEEGVTAALALLPELEHLSLTHNQSMISLKELTIGGSDVLRKLSQLTYLELKGVWQEAVNDDGEYDDTPTDDMVVDLYKLQQLTALKRLADLRLQLPGHPCSFKASMLSSAQHLTHLQLETNNRSEFCFEPGALAGKTLLQHLELRCCYMAGQTAGVARLLSELQPLQQLTCLVIQRSLYRQERGPPITAYSALTASSKLQHLDVSEGEFPAGVWQHVFPAGRQLPHLAALNISGVSSDTLTAADGNSLVSCCPGLLSLNLRRLPCSKEALVALQGLSSLSSLSLQPPASSAEKWVEVVEGVCQLTRLRRLELRAISVASEGVPQQLTQLRQVTYLFHSGKLYDNSFCCTVPGDEPVWRQVLKHLLNHRDPEVAQRAAAALAE